MNDGILIYKLLNIRFIKYTDLANQQSSNFILSILKENLCFMPSPIHYMIPCSGGTLFAMVGTLSIIIHRNNMNQSKGLSSIELALDCGDLPPKEGGGLPPIEGVDPFLF